MPSSRACILTRYSFVSLLVLCPISLFFLVEVGAKAATFLSICIVLTSLCVSPSPSRYFLATMQDTRTRTHAHAHTLSHTHHLPSHHIPSPTYTILTHALAHTLTRTCARTHTTSTSIHLNYLLTQSPTPTCTHTRARIHTHPSPSHPAPTTHSPTRAHTPPTFTSSYSLAHTHAHTQGKVDSHPQPPKFDNITAEQDGPAADAVREHLQRVQKHKLYPNKYYVLVVQDESAFASHDFTQSSWQSTAGTHGHIIPRMFCLWALAFLSLSSTPSIPPPPLTIPARPHPSLSVSFSCSVHPVLRYLRKLVSTET